jgi:hypothetical protein
MLNPTSTKLEIVWIQPGDVSRASAKLRLAQSSANASQQLRGLGGTTNSPKTPVPEIAMAAAHDPRGESHPPKKTCELEGNRSTAKPPFLWSLKITYDIERSVRWMHESK